jgi:2-iminobutanoate/2-iminopropanoate deaminase
MNAVYREFFPKDQPARSTLECKMADPSILVEIDCVAGVR